MASSSAIGNQRQNPRLEPDRVPLRTWIGVAASMLGALDRKSVV